MTEDDVPTFERVPRAPPSFDFDAVKAIIEKHFRVYEVERDVRGVVGAEVAAFYVMGDSVSFDDKYVKVRDAVRALDPGLVVILQHRLGEDVLLVARKPPVAKKGYRLNVILLILTAMTTTLAGSFFWQGYVKAENLLTIYGSDATMLHWQMLLWGALTFSIPLMAILGLHELGHWWIARKHHVHTSLPYFIPVPPPLPFGTFGAFISMREPIPDRKALFDIGAAGPIAGFIVTLPVLITGLVLTAVVAQPLPQGPENHLALSAPDGSKWGYGGSSEFFTTTQETQGTTTILVERVTLVGRAADYGPGNWTARIHTIFMTANATADVVIAYHSPSNATASGFSFAGGANYTQSHRLELSPSLSGNETLFVFVPPSDADRILVEFSWPKPSSGLVDLGNSLAFLGMSWIVDQLVPRPDNVLIHPMGIAGWVGLLVTGINLLPAGQLDGGHVARAMWGERMRYASYMAVGLMVALSFVFTGWAVMAILVLFLGVRHPPPLNDRTELDDRRRIIGFLVAAILVLCFVPIPLQAL
jgi:membrane-associated protease RseP (regulator of RpoE activity)